MRDRLRKCRDPITISRALAVAVVVGSVLNLINHYELLVGDPLTSKALIQVALTYLVPYVVSMHGQVWWCRRSVVVSRQTS